MSDVPLARKRLAEIACRLKAGERVPPGEIRAVLPLLWRRPYARPAAPVQSNRVDEFTAARIRKMAFDYPEMTQQAIAVAFNLTAGRVSEVLQGDR